MSPSNDDQMTNYLLRQLRAVIVFLAISGLVATACGAYPLSLIWWSLAFIAQWFENKILRRELEIAKEKL